MRQLRQLGRSSGLRLVSVDGALVERYVRADQLDLADLVHLADIVEQAAAHAHVRYRSAETRHGWVASFMLRYEILVRARAT